MAIYSTVDCCAVEGSDSFSFPLEGEPSASVVLACSWENRFTLKNDLLFGLLGFPRPHPEIPGLFHIQQNRHPKMTVLLAVAATWLG